MDWSDLVLRLIRAAGALTSAAAGIAALLTEGAFVKREPPLGGRWKEFPFAKYRVTRWGGTLLAVILIAPTVQFIGDWMKDDSDTKTTQDVRHDIITTVRNESKLQLSSARKVIAKETSISSKTAEIAKGASSILKGMDRSLYPFKEITWAYEVSINLNEPRMRKYRDLLRQKAKTIFENDPHFGDNLKAGESITGGTGYESASTFQRFGERKRLLIHIDSPLMPSEDNGLGPILGYDILVDLFKSSPSPEKLTHTDFRSSDYAVTLLSPYSGDTYAMRKAGKDFPFDNYRLFELIYVPALEKSPESDECFVDYYWHAMAKFDDTAEASEVSIIGLPDLCGAQYVIRLITFSGQDDAPLLNLKFLRMRVGPQELLLADNDLTATQTNSMLVYRMSMPTDFDRVLRLFLTIRSDEDTKSLDPNPIRLSAPMGRN